MQIDSVLNVGESAYSQLDELRTLRDKASEWERARTPAEQNAVSRILGYDRLMSLFPFSSFQRQGGC